MTQSAGLAATMISLFISHAVALPEAVAWIPNGANVPGVPALGHADPMGSNGDLNAFGNDFFNADKTWTKELCMTDSDGDGQTNGQELGDPCCEWDADVATEPRWSKGVSDPGVSASMSDKSLWASVNCSTASASSRGRDHAPHNHHNHGGDENPLSEVSTSGTDPTAVPSILRAGLVIVLLLFASA